MEGVSTIPDRSAPTDLRGCGGGPCGRRGARLAPRCGARRAPEDPLPRAGTVRHVLHVSPHRMHHVLMLHHVQPLRALRLEPGAHRRARRPAGRPWPRGRRAALEVRSARPAAARRGRGAWCLSCSTHVLARTHVCDE